MRNRISAIIIDPDYQKHDYFEVKIAPKLRYSEKYFELKILDSTDNILAKLYEFRGFDAIVTVGDKSVWGDLVYMPFSIRKKWTHIDKFDAAKIASNITATLLENLAREETPLSFSFFTCAYKTPEDKLRRLYNSLVAQTYREWDWFVIDDSPNGEAADILESFKDPRITVIKNHSVHGNIGFNKHTIAMMCDGDFLCEVDHDDEVTPDCLKVIKDAYNAYPDSDFFYSCALELTMPSKKPIVYSSGWGWGEGLTKTDIVNGRKVTFSESPNINPYSIRTIFAQPNHIRCWKKDFYHRIGGHNVEMSVLDDQEILIRTFLNGIMTKIDKTLYIQYEGDGERATNSENTQSLRFGEIQRTTMLLKEKYDKAIHDRIIELGCEDDPWDEVCGYSVLWKPHEPGQNTMNHLYKPEDELQ